MAKFELHADYDRNGFLSASKHEYEKRHKQPGAIITPNVDRDDRRLPKTVTDGPVIKLDCTMDTKIAQDNEPAALRVKEITAPATPCKFFIRALGACKEFVSVADAKGRKIPLPIFEVIADFPFTMKGKETNLKVEINAFGATPLLYNQKKHKTPRRLELALICVKADGKTEVLDKGEFTIPSLVLVDDLAPPKRLYIAKKEDGRNKPSISDVESVANAANVPLLRVPPSLNSDDAWLQDQFQFAYCEGPKKTKLPLILHLPRVKVDNLWTGISQNLASFVEKHFPSKNLGLVNDFWRRAFKITDVAGIPHFVTFKASQHSLLQIERVFRVRQLLLHVGQTLLKRIKDKSSLSQGMVALVASGTPSVIETHLQLPKALTLVEKIIDKAKGEPENSDQAKQKILDDWKKNLTEQVQEVVKALPVTNKTAIEVSIGPKQKVKLSTEDIDRFYERLEVVHDSLNYGGNIEVSPPFGKAKRGKIVVGQSGGTAYGTMDDELFHFLQAQEAQPIVEIDTSWLQVAHVDETMAFVPRSGAEPSFAIARTSTKVAQQLLEEAFNLYLSGISRFHQHRLPLPITPIPRTRHTGGGTHPLTMMLRGQYWLHFHPPKVFQPKEPPHIFQDLSFAHAETASLLLQPAIPEDESYRPGPIKKSSSARPGERQYPAGISVLEFLQLDEGCNLEIEEKFLSGIHTVLEERFPGIPILKIPVIFDRVPFRKTTKEEKAQNSKLGEYVRNFTRTTEAFLPNSVNFQVLNKHVMVPRPQGPRMGFDDAAAVLKAVMPKAYPDLKLPKLNKQFFEYKKLHQPVVWLNTEDDKDLERDGADRIVTFFRDGFPKKTKNDEIADSIVTANPHAFTQSGMLRPGWQPVVIPENTVDLMEACILIVLESVGAKVRFVDSWFYHVRSGEIHCGTNAIRKPR